MAHSRVDLTPQNWAEGETLTFSLDRDAMLAGLAIRVSGTIHGLGGGAPALRNTMPGPLLADVSLLADGDLIAQLTGVLLMVDNIADGLEPSLDLNTPAAGGNADLDAVFYLPLVFENDRAVQAGRFFWLDTRRYNAVELKVVCGQLADLGTDIDAANLAVSVEQVKDVVLEPKERWYGKLLKRRRTPRLYNAFTADVVEEGPKSGLLRRLIVVALDTNGDFSAGIVGNVQATFYGGAAPLRVDLDTANAVNRALAEGNLPEGVLVVDWDRLGVFVPAEMYDLREAGLTLSIDHDADGRVQVLFETALPYQE